MPSCCPEPLSPDSLPEPAAECPLPDPFGPGVCVGVGAPDEFVPPVPGFSPTCTALAVITAPPGCALAVSPGAVWFSRRQLMSGSCTNASSIAMTLSLLDRRTDMTPSHVLRKLPSMPLTSIARTSIRVSRNGTRSGNFSLCIEASKQSPKSMCKILPLYRSNMRLLGCLSPKPRRYPTMDITASERVYVVRLSSHVSEDRDLSHRTLARSLPGVFSSACSNTSTCVCVHAAFRFMFSVRVEVNHERGLGFACFFLSFASEGTVRRETGQSKRGETDPTAGGGVSLSPLDVLSGLTDAAR